MRRAVRWRLDESGRRWDVLCSLPATGTRLIRNRPRQDDPAHVVVVEILDEDVLEALRDVLSNLQAHDLWAASGQARARKRRSKAGAGAAMI